MSCSVQMSDINNLNPSSGSSSSVNSSSASSRNSSTSSASSSSSSWAPGSTWTPRTLPNSVSWGSVAYGNGLFVAVSSGTSGINAAVSPDNGVSWNGISLTGGPEYSWVAYGTPGGTPTFVVVAYGSTSVVISTDGTHWNPATGSLQNELWNCVTYGNGYFIAVANGWIAASSDGGNSWFPFSTSAITWSSVAYGNPGGVPTFVAVDGDNNGTSVARSVNNGTSWTTSALLPGNNWNSVTYGNGIFVAVAYGTSAAYSSDGIKWTMGHAKQQLAVGCLWERRFRRGCNCRKY